ncbi:MAG: hypothetical protein JO352_25415 [Chloroflexi bacterium]|nr:hypothetical protein [Chloroflexota bacterium]
MIDRRPSRPPARWSKRTDELVRYAAVNCGPGLQSELGHWIEASPRFATFAAANRDKIRKKLLNADRAEGQLDVRAELRVAHLLLQDERFTVVFEAYGAHQPGPDLTVTYRANQRFNLEVTRIRRGADVQKLVTVVAAKARQLTADSANALVIAGQHLGLSETELGEAARLLKAHADAADNAFFARRGAGNARTFLAHYLRLAGVLLLDEACSARVFWSNREARRPLSAEIVSRLLAARASDTG